MNTIDLNCDMGETPGNQPGSLDEQLLRHVSSANIACGLHAGDPQRMQLTVAAALKHGVAVGAHPGLADAQGFGRQEKPVSAAEVYQLALYQIGALHGFVKAAGSALHHVKAHGALYNMAAKDRALADALVNAVRDFDDQLLLYALAGSEMVRAAQAHGIRVAAEGFADRTYRADGTLTPRSQPDALIADRRAVVTQSLDMAGKVDTLCIHGDGPQAVELAAAIRHVFTQSDITIQPPTVR